uniref:Uncharacterized protein n=1 Tax=Opuntia streptacantha TaxID=393608 RepID=A0A7C9D8X9_OPUST
MNSITQSPRTVKSVFHLGRRHRTRFRLSSIAQSITELSVDSILASTFIALISRQQGRCAQLSWGSKLAQLLHFDCSIIQIDAFITFIWNSISPSIARISCNHFKCISRLCVISHRII